jgi:hypothetical protein
MQHLLARARWDADGVRDDVAAANTPAITDTSRSWPDACSGGEVDEEFLRADPVIDGLAWR